MQENKYTMPPFDQFLPHLSKQLTPPTDSCVWAKHQTPFPSFDFSFDCSDLEIVKIGQKHNWLVVLPLGSSSQPFFMH